MKKRQRNGCQSEPHFTDQDVAQHVEERVYDKYVGAQRKLLEHSLAQEKDQYRCKAASRG
jgi:hypothetical protein